MAKTENHELLKSSKEKAMISIISYEENHETEFIYFYLLPIIYLRFNFNSMPSFRKKHLRYSIFFLFIFNL